MKVHLLRFTPGPEIVAGWGAAICTNTTDWEKALKHAIESGHESVMEHVTFTFEISEVSRTLLAQLTRHRIASFSVQSQRYVSHRNLFGYTIPPSIIELGEDAVKAYEAQMEQMHKWYCEWCDLLGDQKKEDARYVLPNAAHTRLLMTMNARELKHFLSLRMCNCAQWEIRQMADEMYRQTVELAPVLMAGAGPGCVRGHCPEKKPCGHPRGGAEA